MIDWTKPLQTRSGLPARVVHEFYNGVQDMVVVSVLNGASSSKPFEVIKIYDQQWGMDQSKGHRASWDNNSDWDLMEVPPPDKVFYLSPNTDDDIYCFMSDIKQDLSYPGCTAYGQIKVVIDGKSHKIKSTEIL